MPPVFDLARAFRPNQHLVHDLDLAPWRPALRADGTALWGIRGKDGAFGPSGFGHPIGVSMIEMRPGAAFDLHVHEGDHILWALAGRGKVHINGEDFPLHSPTGSVFIPGDYPHGVKTYAFEDYGPDELARGGGMFRFLAFGHPAKAIDALDRMTEVDPQVEEQLMAQLRDAGFDDIPAT